MSVYAQRAAQQLDYAGALRGPVDPVSRVSFDFQFEALPAASSVAPANYSNKSSGRQINTDWCISGPRGGTGGITVSSSAGVRYDSSGNGCFWLITSSKSSARATILKTRAAGTEAVTKVKKFACMRWDTSREFYFGALVKTPAATAISTPAMRWFAGMSLTSAADLATDNDQVKFWFDYATSATAIYVANSIGGTDTLTDSTVDIAASTLYFLELVGQADRTIKAYINGAHVATTGALTAATRLYPFIGVANKSSTSSVAKANKPRLGIYRVLMSQNVV